MMLQKIKLAAFPSMVLLLSGCVQSDFAISREERTVLKTVKRSDIAKASQAPPRKILPQTHFAAARLLEAQGRVAKAIAQYRKAVALNHNYVEAYHRLGILLSVAGQHEQATQMLRRTVAIKPAGAVYHNDLGFELMLREQWAQATQEFRRAVELKPDLPRAHINLGMALSRQGRFEEALAAFRTVLPEPDAYYNLGLMFRGQKRYSEAADAFLHTLSVDPSFTAASTQLEQIAEHLESKPATPPNADAFGPKPSGGIVVKVVPQHEGKTVPFVKGSALTPPEQKPSDRSAMPGVVPVPHSVSMGTTKTRSESGPPTSQGKLTGESGKWAVPVKTIPSHSLTVERRSIDETVPTSRPLQASTKATTSDKPAVKAPLPSQPNEANPAAAEEQPVASKLVDALPRQSGAPLPEHNNGISVAPAPSTTRLVETVEKERYAEEVKPWETIAEVSASRSNLGPVATVFPDTPVFVIAGKPSRANSGLPQGEKAAGLPDMVEKVVSFDPKAWDQWDEDWDWETIPQPMEPAQPRFAYLPPPVPIPAMVTDHRRRRAAAVVRQVVEARAAVGMLQDELGLVRDQIKCWGDVMEEESATAQEAARIDELVEAALTKEAVRRVLSHGPVITVAEVAGPVCPVFDKQRLAQADDRAVMCPVFPEGWDQVNEDSGLWPLLPPLDPIYVSAMLEGSDVASDPMVVWNGSGYLVQPIDWGPLADRCPLKQARATLASVIEPTVPHESGDILEDSSGLRTIERLGVTVKDAHEPVPEFPPGPLDWVENFGELDDVLSILRNEINCRAERKASRGEGEKTDAP